MVPYICFYCGTLLILLGSFIIFLHVKEKDEDSKIHDEFV